MKRARTATRARAAHLKVGDRVRFEFGGRKVVGTIIEDRGRIGAGGRRLFAVRFRADLGSEGLLELPADEIQAA